MDEKVAEMAEVAEKTRDCDCGDIIIYGEDALKNYNGILIGQFLCQLTTSYKQLIDGADVMNKIGLAHRRDIEQAVDRADELGHIIDDLLHELRKAMRLYTNEVDRSLELQRSGITERNRNRTKKEQD